MADLFNHKTKYHETYKRLFDEIESIYISSEDLIADIGYQEIENLTYEQKAFCLILTRSKKLFISLLILCSEGHGEDAGILLRSLFESYINMEYIRKHNLAEKYIKYIIIAQKSFYDIIKKLGLTADIENNKTYKIHDNDISRRFNEVKGDFISKKGKVRDKWTGKDLRAMAEDLDKEEVAAFIKARNLSIDPKEVYGEKQVSYELLYKYHSSFIHCNPYAQGSFANFLNNRIEFDCRPSSKDIEMVLVASKIIYARIVFLWMGSFNKIASDIILATSKISLASPLIINQGLKDSIGRINQ